MPTPKSGYYVEGKRVPSVTTIISATCPKNLVDWAVKLAKAGKSHEVESEAARNVGTCVHACIEHTLAGEPIPPSVADDLREEDKQPARNAYAAWQSWHSKLPKCEVLASECSMSSSAYMFGGTLDTVADIGAGPTLCDWKTSKGIFPEHLCQLGAYALLWSENHPDQPLERMVVVRLDKETAEYQERVLLANSDEVKRYQEWFITCCHQYRAAQLAGAMKRWK